MRSRASHPATLHARRKEVLVDMSSRERRHARLDCLRSPYHLCGMSTQRHRPHFAPAYVCKLGMFMVTYLEECNN
jgi:hypothetical protein